MNDPKEAEEKVVEPTPDTPPVSKEEPKEPEKEPEANSEVKEEESSQEPLVKSSEGEEAPKKPTRAERRIPQLLEKLRSSGESKTDAPSLSQILGPEQPLIRPDEYEQGVDPNELERRFQDARLRDREVTKRELRAEMSFEQSVKDNLSDVESTQKELEDEPEQIDRYVAEQYQALNFNAQGQFVPRKKMSEILKDAKSIMEAYGVKAVSEVTGKMVKQAEESAVAPSRSGAQSRDYTAESQFEKARESGSMEDWAAVLKKRIFSSDK